MHVVLNDYEQINTRGVHRENKTERERQETHREQRYKVLQESLKNHRAFSGRQMTKAMTYNLNKTSSLLLEAMSIVMVV